MGDFADVPVEGTYRLIHVVFNTLFNLLTQQEQAWCFENVASHLTKDLLSVVEAFVPSYLNRLRDDQYVDAEHIGVGSVRFDVGRHDSVAQRLDETRVVLSRRAVYGRERAAAASRRASNPGGSAHPLDLEDGDMLARPAVDLQLQRLDPDPDLDAEFQGDSAAAIECVQLAVVRTDAVTGAGTALGDRPDEPLRRDDVCWCWRRRRWRPRRGRVDARHRRNCSPHGSGSS